MHWDIRFQYRASAWSCQVIFLDIDIAGRDEYIFKAFARVIQW